MTTKQVALLSVLWVFCTHCADAQTSSSTGSAQDIHAHSAGIQPTAQFSHAPQGDQGAQRAIVDPETGQLVSPPEHDDGVAIETMESHASSSSAESMPEKESPVPGGGMMINLQGRFQSPLTATINKSGQTEIEHHADDTMQ